MWPSSYPNPSIMATDGSQPKQQQQQQLVEGWHWYRNGDCPQGTIPIRNTSQNHHLHLSHFHTKHLNYSYTDPPQDHEYAQASQYDGIYYGLQAIINVWNPKTEEGGLGEFSISQVWVVSLNRSDPTNLNSVEAGWIVSPTMFGDNKTRFFIFWTKDNYRTTGCYNLNCPGFVQTNHKFIIGNSIAPVSTYNGKSYDISITMFKDGESGNWWLEVQGEVVGYWPSSIFTGLANNANIVSWGGEIINSRSAGHHTTTQMGSGHFATEGFHKSSYFRNLKVIDDAGNTQDPENLQPHVSNSKCYDLQFQENKQTSFGTCFYYGGPGYSLDCP